MGEAELNIIERQIIIHSNIIVYGNAADAEITESIRDEIETMWNEPNAIVKINGGIFNLAFRITAELKINIKPADIHSNISGRNNFFRIEEYSSKNISFVDGIGCNSGYFFTENLYKGSTTAAHEYGHTIGLDHPVKLDIRGKGQPGIMYPRGTIVDPEYQYDPATLAGLTGGTMHPKFRKVYQLDIDGLKFNNIDFTNNKIIIGRFSNVHHEGHIR